MESAASKLAKILRTGEHLLLKIDERLSSITGREGVLERITAQNEEKIKEKLLILGVSRNAPAREIYDALISKIEADDNKIYQAFNRPVCGKHEDCERILSSLRKIALSNHGLFLKREKAIEFLEKEPPPNVLKYLKYDSVSEMLKHEDLFEVYSSLRFVEGSEWLNAVFFKQYENLMPSDFEERPIELRVLGDRWVKIAQDFLKKKKHNISHLKEMGVIYVIPAMIGISGELLRMISMVLHYLHEVPYYSDLFKRAAENPKGFARDVISYLRGDVIDHRPAEAKKIVWLVVQRYLAKEDENNWRLFYPHINPEALHWLRAEEDLVKLGTVADGFNADMAFWHDLDWVGDYFRDEIGVPLLVSFDLVDTVMSLVKEREMVKYLYHHQEALWNKIFIEYFSREELDKFSKDYLLQGYFEI